MVATGSAELDTKPNEIYDLSGELRSFLAGVGASDGAVLVFAVGSTCGVTTIEYEPGLRRDFPELMERLVPAGRYHHDATWGDANGHSHLRSSLVGTSLVIPVLGGEPATGTWQQVVFCEFDVRPRRRRVIFQFIGEAKGR